MRYYSLFFSLFVSLLFSFSVSHAENTEKIFVGSANCASCHEEEFASFKTHSKKAKSWNSVQIMATKLTEAELKECYTCHTTGYGQGGFVSYETTPQFADVGCETCHGPGSLHAETGDPATIIKLPTKESCMTCHNEQRVKAFHFKPLRFGGAH